MLVPREHEGGFRHLPALFSMYCLQTVRIAIPSNGIWFLVVVLIIITPVIIWDAEHLVLWLFGFFFPLFLFSFLKGCEENWPFEIGFLNLGVFGAHFCNTWCRTFPEGSCHYLPYRPFESEVPVSTGGQVQFQEVSTRRQHFSTPNSGSTCTQSLRESRLPGLWVRVEGAKRLSLTAASP